MTAPTASTTSVSPSRAMLLCFAVNLAAFVVLVAMVVVVGRGFWYDETYYLESVSALHRQGFGIEFLRDLPGPAGPLYALVHFALEPLTGLRPLPTRLANIGLFALTLVPMAAALRERRVDSPGFKAIYLLSAPMMFGVVGTALTDLPPLLAFCISLSLLLRAVEGDGRGRSRAVILASAAGAGLAMGIAVTGRQQYLPAIAAAAFLAIGPNRRAGFATVAVYMATALVLPAMLFLAWGGAVPPRTAFVGEGISLAHLGLSFAFAGVVYSIHDTGWIRGWWPWFVGLIAASTAANLALGFVEHLPLRQLAYRFLADGPRILYARATSGLMLGFGLAFMVWIARQAISGDAVRRYLVMAMLAMLLTPAKITHQFAGRYVVAALPILLLISCEDSTDSAWKALRMAVACLIGLASLNAYLTS